MASASLLRTDGCGCADAVRRICDLCYQASGVFLACSLACLGRHQRSCHPGRAGDSSEARARSAASAYNRRFPDSRQTYARH
ncbi:MAG TPA: hypothetical protein VNW92_19765, partial [Polyangiaceae bacterium]|nr:hypothetical protein [Polyangiaceae bacterium]